MLGLGYAKLFWRHLLIFKAPHRQWDGYHLRCYSPPEFLNNVRVESVNFTGPLVGWIGKLKGQPQLPHYLQDSLASVRGGSPNFTDPLVGCIGRFTGNACIGGLFRWLRRHRVHSVGSGWIGRDDTADGFF